MPILTPTKTLSRAYNTTAGVEYSWSGDYPGFWWLLYSGVISYNTERLIEAQ